MLSAFGSPCLFQLAFSLRLPHAAGPNSLHAPSPHEQSPRLTPRPSSTTHDSAESHLVERDGCHETSIGTDWAGLHRRLPAFLLLGLTAGAETQLLQAVTQLLLLLLL